MNSNNNDVIKSSKKNKIGVLNWPLFSRALLDAVTKLHPKYTIKNPVIFIVEIGSVISTYYMFKEYSVDTGNFIFNLQITIWLWFTVYFANFSECLAEGRGKAQAENLRSTKVQLMARIIVEGQTFTVPASDLLKGNIVECKAGDIIPIDGEVIEGAATVDESAITGESAPVIRESGGDRSSVTGGTKVLSDRIVFKVTSNPGESFIDRMIALVEGAERQKTPNEIALSILLSGLTIIFLLATATLVPFITYSSKTPETVISIPIIISLLVCLIPTTIGGLLSAIGIAGMDRVMQYNVLAMSGRAVEAAGDVNTLLLDKTGTITIGNRQASEFIPANGIATKDIADIAQLASLADETPEGRSIVILAKEKYGIRERNIQELNPEFVPFTAQTRMSGVNIGKRIIRKGASGAILKYIEENNGVFPNEIKIAVDDISKKGGTPLVVVENNQVVGVVHLKDIVKGGIKNRFIQLRAMGIKTVMITGDNPLTAAAIAAEAGVDDFIAEATPEAKLKFIRKEQENGRLVAMTGDGTNDAPALAQADVGVAMNSGTQAAKEAGNMIDLDSNPTKLIEIVSIGKQMLMTRGALTTFSIANDIAKYFAIIPAIFVGCYPELSRLNFIGLTNPHSSVLAAVIFNALIIIVLIPLALKGVAYRPVNAASILKRNILVYGLGGIIAPFPGIFLLDRLLVALHLA